MRSGKDQDAAAVVAASHAGPRPPSLASREGSLPSAAAPSLGECAALARSGFATLAAQDRLGDWAGRTVIVGVHPDIELMLF
jgi:hypothetical protein